MNEGNPLEAMFYSPHLAGGGDFDSFLRWPL